MRTLFTIFCLLFLSISVKAQNIERTDYHSIDAVLNSRDDTTYIVHFWATWCRPCKEEFSDFMKLYKKHRDDEVRIIFVTFDMPHEADKSLIPYLKKNHYHASVWVVDATKVHEWLNKVSKEWNGTVPATIIAKQGRKHFFEHMMDYTALKSEVKMFNAE